MPTINYQYDYRCHHCATDYKTTEKPIPGKPRHCALCGAIMSLNRIGPKGGVASLFEGTLMAIDDPVKEYEIEAYDPHYKKIEKAMGIESTAKLGEVLFGLRAGTMPDTARLCLDKALKYVLRAGLKKGQPWQKDLDKAINFLTRAKTGRWAG